ncbi:MAG: SAM-dependent methyltransferase [Actinomycetota bacterium]|nr:SAM-dependent methyltransferase [Actinomycetota bacterium]
MNPLHHKLLTLIDERGSLPFAEFMDIALYDPEHGYYSGGGERTGWRGDFLTSPELDPAFGILWLRGLEQIWEVSGRPTRFDLVEVGPGEGGFAAALLEEADGPFADALKVTLVELSDERRKRQRRRLGDLSVSWARGLEEIDAFASGCVFANEVLDNQPIHVLRTEDGELLELHVAQEDGRLVEQWRKCSDARTIEAAGGSTSEAKGTIEVSPAADALVEACASLVKRGAVVFVDYGRDGAVHHGGSVVTFSSSGVDSLRLDEPGSRDITAHVDWDSVRRALVRAGLETVGPERQRSILLALGAAALDGDLRKAHGENLERGRGAAAVRMLSRRQALRALLDPGGLGRLQVFAGFKGIEVPPFLRQKEDRP